MRNFRTSDYLGPLPAIGADALFVVDNLPTSDQLGPRLAIGADALFVVGNFPTSHQFRPRLADGLVIDPHRPRDLPV